MSRFARDALLLIGHGSSAYDDAGAMLDAHAAVLRGSGLFAEVATAYLANHPNPADVLPRLRQGTVHAVPFFMEDGYFTTVALPKALSLAPATAAFVRLYPPVGTHPAMPTVITAEALGRAQAAGIHPLQLCLVLVGHGSGRAPGRRTALHAHAEAVRAGGRFRDVRVAFLEEPPLLGSVLAAGREGPVAVMGFLANRGGHARDDIPALIAAEQPARPPGAVPVVDFGTIGDARDIPSLIIGLIEHGG